MIIDTIVQYGIGALHSIRGIILNLVKSFNYDSTIIMAILIGLISLYLGYLITKNFVTKPYEGKYILWYLIISILIFIILNYL